MMSIAGKSSGSRRKEEVERRRRRRGERVEGGAEVEETSEENAIRGLKSRFMTCNSAGRRKGTRNRQEEERRE